MIEGFCSKPLFLSFLKPGFHCVPLTVWNSISGKACLCLQSAGSKACTTTPSSPKPLCSAFASKCPLNPKDGRSRGILVTPGTETRARPSPSASRAGVGPYREWCSRQGEPNPYITRCSCSLPQACGTSTQ